MIRAASNWSGGPPPVDADAFEPFAGTYVLADGDADGGEHTVYIGGFLGAPLPALHDFRTRRIGVLYPVSETTARVGPALFVPEPPEIVLTFLPGDDGEVGLLWQVVGGEAITGARGQLPREEVTFVNGGVTLAGTLFLPPAPGPHPAVVLVHGSGAQTRACVRLHAEHFARQGIAALAYDKRGAGGSSPGLDDFRELARDALAGLRLLQHHAQIDARRIGLCGSSQGGWIAPLAAAEAPREVAFVILVAGPAVSIAEENRQNVEYSMRAAGFSAEQVAAGVRQALAFNELIRTGEGWEEFRALTEQAEREGWVRYALSPTLKEPPPKPARPRTGMDEDPVPVLEQVRCPVLALFGEWDTVVPAVENAPRLEAALHKHGHPHHQVIVVPGANHLFHEADPSGKFGRSQRFLPEYLRVMAEWVGALPPARSW